MKLFSTEGSVERAFFLNVFWDVHHVIVLISMNSELISMEYNQRKSILGNTESQNTFKNDDSRSCGDDSSWA